MLILFQDNENIFTRPLENKLYYHYLNMTVEGYHILQHYTVQSVCPVLHGGKINVVM